MALRLGLIILPFLSIFLPYRISNVNIENLCLIFSRTNQARNFKLGIFKDNDWLYSGIRNGVHYSYSSFYLSIFLSFQGKFVSGFFVLLFFCLSIFLSLFHTLKVCIKVGLVTIQARIFKLGILINNELFCEINNADWCFYILISPSDILSRPIFWLARFDIYFSFYNGWMTCDCASFSTVFQSCKDNGRMIMKGYVQWNPVYGREDFASSEARSRDR